MSFGVNVLPLSVPLILIVFLTFLVSFGSQSVICLAALTVLLPALIVYPFLIVCGVNRPKTRL